MIHQPQAHGALGNPLTKHGEAAVDGLWCRAVKHLRQQQQQQQQQQEQQQRQQSEGCGKYIMSLRTGQDNPAEHSISP
jgi:transcription initiation factor TFIID subunit TAF12